ncbi:TPA: DNA gyrase subunit A [Candidatus Uhrbacteria bacterium]|nr:DNA gyrase subunit A [Candidatus Uhrbacteria bacterium]
MAKKLPHKTSKVSQTAEGVVIDAPFATTIGQIQPQNISEEMRRAYLDYAMSVIVSRALPDVRDGMKPVHRRILYAMWSIGLRANAKFRKSATIVGEVLGKYHPHGDSSVYESMVRMAQDFSYRMPLVTGQGNFGSMDGDSAAAYRYTEAKLSSIAEELLLDIEKNTVDFRPNYDASHDEPSVLPAKFPNLLVNGTLGIAVGMATNIPPHNLGEVCNAVIHLIENPEATVEDLLEHIKGPDFPTGGIAYSHADIRAAYSTGRGGVVTRAVAEIVEDKKGMSMIVITEVPYMVNKAAMIEKMADLIRDKKLEGIRDLRDESNKEGVRVVIELKKDAYPRKVLNRLFQSTALQTTFHYNMLALVDGIQPRILNVKMILEEWLKHRREVVKRRTQFELDKIKDRLHILEGLRIALERIDEVIATIKKSKDKDEARVNLMTKFKMTERQAVAILEMRLQALANLERLRIEEEYQEKLKIMKELMAILASEKRMLGVIKDETLELMAKYPSPRRTQIMRNGIKEFSMEDIIPDVPAVIMMTKDGYIKRLPPDTFSQQGRGGKGVIGLTTKEEDQIEAIYTATTHQDMMFFTSRGRVFRLKAYDIPEASRTAKGQAIVNFLELAPGEKVSAVLNGDLKAAKAKYIIMVTNRGTIKKTKLEDFENVRKSGLIAIKLNDGDNLEWVRTSGGKDDIMLVTNKAMSIRFSENDVRPMGRVASGVRGIKLKGDDYVVGMEVMNQDAVKEGRQLLVIMENGLGKRTDIEEYGVQNRGGQGVKTAMVTAKTGQLAGAYIVKNDDPRDLLMVSRGGQVIRLSVKSVSLIGRATQGVRVMRFKTAGDTVVTVTMVGGDDKVVE